MGGGVTARGIAWAATHDWFVRATTDGVVVFDDLENDLVTFTSLSKLRAWAGY